MPKQTTNGGDLATPTTMQDVAAEALARKAAGVEAEAVADELKHELDAESAALAEALDKFVTAAASAEEEVVAGLSSEVLTPNSFLASPEMKLTLTLGKPKGVHIPLGRILAVINRTETITTQYGPSIALCGLFRAIAVERNNLELSARKLFWTLAFSERIQAALVAVQRHDPAGFIELDVDVGLEATGKVPLSYTWTAVHYLKGSAAKVSRDQLLAKRKLVGSQSGQRAIAAGGAA